MTQMENISYHETAVTNYGFTTGMEKLADILKAETAAQWTEHMLLCRAPPGSNNFSLITVLAEEEL